MIDLKLGNILTYKIPKDGYYYLVPGDHIRESLNASWGFHFGTNVVKNLGPIFFWWHQVAFIIQIQCVPRYETERIVIKIKEKGLLPCSEVR